MTYEQRLEKAARRLELDNKVRVYAFTAAAFLAAIFYAGYTFFPESGWFHATGGFILVILMILAVVIVVSTFMKFFFIASYNKVIKLHREGKI